MESEAQIWMEWESLFFKLAEGQIKLNSYTYVDKGNQSLTSAYYRGKRNLNLKEIYETISLTAELWTPVKVGLWPNSYIVLLVKSLVRTSTTVHNSIKTLELSCFKFFVTSRLILFAKTDPYVFRWRCNYHHEGNWFRH